MRLVIEMNNKTKTVISLLNFHSFRFWMKSLASALCIIVGLTAFGQEEPTGEIQDVQVIIEKDKPLTLPQAGRKFQRADLKKINSDTIKLNYSAIGMPGYRFDVYQPTFQSKAYKDAKRITGFNNFVKAGYGNLQSPVFETYVGVKDRLNYVGLWAQHESFGKGPIRGAESAFSNNQFILDGNYVARIFQFKPILNYNRNGFNFYGYDFEAFSNAPTDESKFLQERIVSETWEVGGTISNYSNEDLSISFTPTYRSAGMKEKGSSAFNSDNGINLLSDFSYRIKDNITLNTNLGYEWSQYNGNSEPQNRSRLFVKPGVSLVYDNLQIDAGINLVSGKNRSTNFYVYPDLNAQYFINDRYAIRLKVDGDLTLNTIETLQNQNLFLEDSLLLLNTNRKFGITSSFQARLNDRLIVEGIVGYDQFENQLLFINSPNDSSRFTLGYDDNFGQLMLGAKASYRIEEQTNITSQFTYYIYNEGSVGQAWFLPLRKFELSATHEFFKKLNLGIHFFVIGGIKAPEIGGNDSFTSENFMEQDAIVDLGMSANYNIKDRISLFANANNLFNQEYQWYSNYPSRGLTAKLGFIFRF